jgi:uncharacterized protein (TIGR02453 family)
MKRPVFSGFPVEGLQFLRSLTRNNNREWFQEHKGIYEANLKEPMMNLIASLAEDFAEFAPEMMASPKASAYRIHRDTRFSKDKSPYKTHVAAVFPRSGLGKHEGAGLYLHLSPAEVFVGGGLYMPQPEDLNVVRQRILEDDKAFRKIVQAGSFKRLFGELHGEQLSRVPRGFPPDHPAAEYLRYKQFLAARTFPPTLATSRSFYSDVVKTFRAMMPFIRFLNEPIVQARRVRERQDAWMRSLKA